MKNKSGDSGWKDALTIEVFLSLCLIAFAIFIFFTIIFRLNT
jgi:hypothetical protein